MTWSISHTVPVTSLADNHTALVYLFDTYIAGKTAWTVSAHPDASAYKRSLQCTVNNKFGGTYTMYHWVNWSSTTPTNWSWYEDATYTTTPGDLGTDSTNQIPASISFSSSGTSWLFCTSDENSQSMLVIYQGKPIFYWPGITEGLFFEDDSWDGTSDSLRTHIIPHVGGAYASLSCLNSPVGTAASGTEYYMVPSVGYQYSSISLLLPSNTGSWIGTNFDWWYSQSTTTLAPGHSTMPGFTNGGHTDCGILMPGSGWYVGNDNRQPFYMGGSGGVTYQIGSNYWWGTSSNVGRCMAMFDFGTSDPGIS